jgi:hypothetical protein
MATEYIIYCDESEEKGLYFSNFYGGALVRSEDLESVKLAIAAKKAELYLKSEVKWEKITANYAQKYIDLIDCFFDFIKAGKVKIRIMFTQNMNVAKNLTTRHVDEKYFILYYQFIKHAFGLQLSPVTPEGLYVRVYPDRMPDTSEKVNQFRWFLCALTRDPDFRRVGIRIRPQDVSEVDSHHHDILQCLDIVLGAMQFRLNDKHLEKTASSGKRRGKRTKAKARVYRHILSRVQDIYPRFNIGTSTGQPDTDSRWTQPYRHWLFVPYARTVVSNSKKRKKGSGTP